MNGPMSVNGRTEAIVDLHCHSRHSDGSLSLRELLLDAGRRGVTHLAVTDHDTTQGIAEAMRLGEMLDIVVIPGIEITAFDYARNRRAHILGYYVKRGDAALEAICSKQTSARHSASRAMTERIVDAGYAIDWNDVEALAEGGTGVYKQHIMHALIIKGYTDRIYGPLYRELFARGNDGRKPGIAYMPLEYVDAPAAIRAIRAAGGVPVLAHPGQFDNFAAIPEWREAGLEGVEVLHPLHRPEEERRAADYARAFHLIETGGSDFHGLYGEGDSAPLGGKNAGLHRYEQLIERYALLRSGSERSGM